MDVKNFSILLGIICLFSLFFTSLFVRPEKEWRRKIFTEAQINYRNYLLSLSNIFLGAILFDHIFINRLELDPIIVFSILGFLLYSNLPAFGRGNGRL
ncbi:MAG: hypothetical protein CME64_14870 [Halobacteriovoraceae bacterium]|nr:hypothetical protein [Halobacteriovoraceae bacterium]|tara:strand:+ start:21477 stop:21770 length:294 start_codon:yes stop_codon:yes gene_type:complete